MRKTVVLNESEIPMVYADRKRLWEKGIVYTVIDNVFYRVMGKPGDLLLVNDNNHNAVANAKTVSDLMKISSTEYFMVETVEDYRKEQAVHKFMRNLKIEADGRNYYIESLHDLYRLDCDVCSGGGYDVLVEHNEDMDYLFSASNLDDAIRSLYEYEQKLPSLF